MSSMFEVWIRNSFEVHAVRITEMNLYAVSVWCDGTIHRTSKGEKEQYIRFGETRYNRIKETNAYIGDWILQSDNGEFKHYRDASFRLAYKPKVRRYEEVLALVEGAMGGNSYNVDGFGQVIQAEEVAREIVKLFGEE